ncbi:hypothetical protein GCM10022215_42600 [Nocardioides fonticola]|uniref:DUF2510 domain-containing protein n=1 Tax=Nocardioides fonticola TaxID=450363 RepID=A0ABP7Y2W7_9ACTN
MTENDTPPGWYPDTQVPGQQRYWDGSQWTAQVAPLAPAPTQYPTAPMAAGEADRPWFKKKRFLLPIAAVVLIGIGGAAGGGSDDEKPTASDTPASASPTTSAVEDAADDESSAEPTAKAEPADTADDQPAPDDGTKPSFVLPKQNGDWRLDSLQIRKDGLGSFDGIGRITYTGDDQDGGDNFFTVTLFARDRTTIVTTLDGSATDVKPGQTVTVQFISFDDFKPGRFPFTFQNNF